MAVKFKFHVAGVLVFCLFVLPLRATPTNDVLSGSVVLTGTNVTGYGNTQGATLEPGEPHPYGTNTIWFSWVAPATGFGWCSESYAAIFTGPTADHLQPVHTEPVYYARLAFVAVEGMVYHFQVSNPNNSGSAPAQCTIEFVPYPACLNDNFTNAIEVKGSQMFHDIRRPVSDATLELGEPAHSATSPFKSLWWKWQAPVNGISLLNSYGSLVSNITLIVYTGDSLGTLSLVPLHPVFSEFTVVGGRTYYVAAVVHTNAVGDMVLAFGYGIRSGATVAVPGNLLQEPSWEGTALEPAHWSMSGSIGGYVNENGGADGRTWPAVSHTAKVWQDFSTIAGRTYRIRFAFLVGGDLSQGGGDANVRVLWNDNQLGVATSPENEGGYWHWAEFSAIASNTTTRLMFENLARTVELDAFSVVDVTAPPVIVKQPAPLSVITGGTAALFVGVTGFPPLHYQWFFNGSVMTNQTDWLLTLAPVTTNSAGNYRVIITNSFGSITSEVAELAVDAPLDATILSQPYGDTVPVGGYCNFSVVAAGTPPITYLWFKDNAELLDATNRNLSLTNVQLGEAGAYHVLVQNPAGSVSSLPAILVVSTNTLGGGQINFRNKFTFGFSNAAPVFDIDAVTPLNGNQYVAQLYSGPSLAMLRPASQPTPFQSGFDAGIFVPQIVTLPNVAAGENAFLQVRAWDSYQATSYEEARARGEKFGKSIVLELIAGGDGQPPPQMLDLQSFNLQAGLPFFTVGVLSLLEQQSNEVIWQLEGEPGFRYLIEKDAGNSTWKPFTVVTNVTGTVTFSDSMTNSASIVLYRSRILD